MNGTRRQFVSLAGILATSTLAKAATWNQWRGPFRNGVVDSDKPWPTELGGSHLTEVWRQELQPSYSGPVVADGKVFVTETVGKKSEAVTAFSLSDGQQIWKTDWVGAMSVPFFARANGSWIRSTPAAVDGKLLVAGMRDVLTCVDTSTGNKVWQNDFVETQKSSVPSFGFVCSPLVHEQFVYVQAGGGFLKVEFATGKVVWRSIDDGGGMNGSAFSSPVIATLNGVEQLLVQTRTELAGVSLDGEKLWSVDIPAFRGMNILPPTAIGDSVFTSSYGGGSFSYAISRNGDNWSATKQWENRVQGYMSSPLVLGEHVYLHLRNQRFTCLDLATGEQKWSSRPFGKYWSTIAHGDRILALDERGDLLLLKPQPEKFELLDQKKVASNSWAHLAVVDDLILVRDLNALIVYRWT